MSTLNEGKRIWGIKKGETEEGYIDVAALVPGDSLIFVDGPRALDVDSIRGLKLSYKVAGYISDELTELIRFLEDIVYHKSVAWTYWPEKGWVSDETSKGWFWINRVDDKVALACWSAELNRSWHTTIHDAEQYTAICDVLDMLEK